MYDTAVLYSQANKAHFDLDGLIHSTSEETLTL